MKLSMMKRLGQLFYAGNTITFYYSNAAKTIVITMDGVFYTCSDNEGIGKTLCDLLDRRLDQLQMVNMFIFYNSDFSHGKAADDELYKHFFDCEWTDYTHDNLCFQATLYHN